MKSRPTLGKDGRLHISESVFQSDVMKAAKLCGWLAYHAKPAMVRKKDGGMRWLTAMSGDPGFPDTVLTKAGRVWLIELKTDSGTVSDEQQAWLDELAKCKSPFVRAFVLRPKDWEQFWWELKQV